MLGNGSKTEALWCRVRAGEKSCTSGKVSSGCLSVSTDIWLLFVAHLKHWVLLIIIIIIRKFITRTCSQALSMNRRRDTVLLLLPTTTTVLRSFVRDYPGEPVPEETLTHPPSWSLSSLYQLLPSTTIHSILLVQITCLAIILHNLFPCTLWSTSWSGASTSYAIHFFTQSVSSFRSTCPYHRNLFCYSINVISSIPSLSLNSLLGTLSFTLTLHIHLTILISAVLI